MEKLLNKLVEKGWKPFGIKSDNIWLYCLSDNKMVISYYDFDTEWECNHEDKWCDLRQLTSKESWLWKFVCENNLVEYDTESWWGEFSFNTDYINWFYWKHIFESNYQYRLIESALTDEDKLEDFILSNIKIDE